VNLKLGKNKLIELPESVGRCKALQMLMLEENELKQLPRSLGHCHALRVVDVSGNQLKMIPSTMSRCQKMVKLVAFDNPLKLPREVMDEGTKALMSLLEAIGNAEEGGYLRMFNIKLRAVPEFTFDMTSLTMLNLDKNRWILSDSIRGFCQTLSVDSSPQGSLNRERQH
jgi:Leucine-rich repeat (LRR) protein